MVGLFNVQIMVLLDVQMGRVLRFPAHMGFVQIVCWLRVELVLEMKDQWFLSGQSKRICRSKMEMRELKIKVRWVHLEVKPQRRGVWWW